MNGQRLCLSLVKGREHYVFHYFPGQESRVLAWLVELAGDPRTGFDWYDAAVLSFQMGKGLLETSDAGLGG